MEANAGQSHEDDLAELVIICSPSLPKMMGTLHPAASLYEKPVNIQMADAQHGAFRKLLEESGIKVLDVRDILADVGTSVKLRVQLEDLAARSLTYVFDTDVTSDHSPRGGSRHNSPMSSPTSTERRKRDDYYASDAYKESVLSAVATEQLVDMILTRPTVTIKRSNRDTGYIARYEFEPLTNLVFTRDQQITTMRGIVMTRLKSAQRQCEVEVMKFCFERLGLKVIGEIPDGANLEGGDFFPVGEDLAMIGIGLRSDMAACQYLMDNDLLGTHHLAVVEDRYDQSQDRMHLDCCFNILSRTCCLAWEGMLGEHSLRKRVVTEFKRDPATKKYSKVREEVEFSEYLAERGFNIIRVSDEAQLLYGCNVLNLGNQTVIAVHQATARDIVRSPFFTGDVKFLDFSQITNMYGACHCASQVVKRTPLRRKLQTFLSGL